MKSKINFPFALALILAVVLSGCSMPEKLYHKIHVTLNLGWETDLNAVDTGSGTMKFPSKGSGVAEFDFVFDDNGGVIGHDIVAQEGYVYVTNYEYIGSGCTITLPSERTSPENQDEWATAMATVGTGKDGNITRYTLYIEKIDYLNSPTEITLNCGMAQPVSYTDSTIDYMLFGGLSKYAKEGDGTKYGFDIVPELGSVYKQSFSGTLDGKWSHTTDATATYLGTYKTSELSDFDEMADL
ncbi:MAG: hypothetical protein WC897_05735 [Candidatus Gracilibacteria bacterium]